MCTMLAPARAASIAAAITSSWLTGSLGLLVTTPPDTAHVSIAGSSARTAAVRANARAVAAPARKLMLAPLASVNSSGPTSTRLGLDLRGCDPHGAARGNGSGIHRLCA